MSNLESSDIPLFLMHYLFETVGLNFYIQNYETYNG